MSLKCSGSGTADTCLTGSDVSSTNTAPLCGTAAQTGTTVGVCGKCQKTVANGGGDGDGSSQGTCTDAAALNRCTASGECKCQKAGPADGDGTSAGTCTDTELMCKADGTCKCAKVTGTAGDGDGTTMGSCGTGECCCSDGTCKTIAALGIAACTATTLTAGGAYNGC